MKAIVAEWISKAEGDWVVAERESRVRENPNYDAVCFHAQQCAEKYLKARMRDAELDPPMIHDLLALLDQTVNLEPAWVSFQEDMAVLSEYAVRYRYPGEAATEEEALDSLRAVRNFRKHARQVFGLD